MLSDTSFPLVADDVSRDLALGGVFDGVLEAYRQ